MIVTIEKVSKYGVMINGEWKNLSKFHTSVNLNNVRSGDTVDIELQKDKYITSLTKLGASSNDTDQSNTTPASTPSSSQPQTDTKQLTIVRLSSVKSVLGSPLVAELGLTKDQLRAMIEEMTTYSLTGRFETQSDPVLAEAN